MIRLIKRALHWFSLVQRLPIYFFVILTLGIGRLIYLVFGAHKPFIIGMKQVLKLALFLRGVRLKFILPKGVSLHELSGIHITNHTDPLLIWLLIVYLPNDHLLIASDSFFSWKSLNSILFLLGFIPQEHGIRPEMLESFSSRMTPYIEQGFGLWQPIHFQYRDLNALPYGVILGLLTKTPISIWQIKNAQQLEQVHWLNRRVVTVAFVTQVPISKRLPITISTYHHIVDTHFGLPESEQLIRVQNDPKRPMSPAATARQKIVEMRKRQAEQENEFPSP